MSPGRDPHVSVGASRGGAVAWKSGRSYSGDPRSRVPAAMDGGGAAKAVARQFQVSVSYIDEASGRREATGETEPRPQRNCQTLKPKDPHAAIAAELASRSDITRRSCARGCWNPARSRRASA